MAFEEIKLSDEELKAAMQGGGKFFKFDAIGQSVGGYFVDQTTDTTGKFGPQQVYHIQTKDGPVKITGSMQLDATMRKAKSEGKLNKGDKVLITYAELIPLDGDKNMKKFKFKREAGNGTVPAAPNAPAAPPPPKPPEEDIGF